MKPSQRPELSLDQLAELEAPHLDLASVDVHALRRDPAASTFAWMEPARRLLGKAQEAPPAETARRPGTREREQTVQLGPFEIGAEPDRVAVRQEGRDRWVIDTRAFTGTSVSMTVDDGAVVIVLSDALFPGTTVPADMKARIWLEKGVWQIRLRLKVGGFDATLALQDWLNRTQLAISGVDLNLSCLPLGPASALVARGTGVAAFTPDWLLGILGAEVFEVDGVAERVTADLGVIALLPASAPQVVLPPSFRRTVIVLGSVEQFPLLPDLGAGDPEIVLDDFRFDSLSFDAGVDAANAAWRVLIARSVADPTTMGLVPGGDLRATDGRPFRIPLANPLYVVLYDEARTVQGAALVAHGPPAPVWMHAPTCSLLVQRSQQPPVIGLLTLPGQDRVVNCRLQLAKSAFHLPGMLVSPQPALRTEVLFTWKPLTTPLPPRTVHVEIDSANDVAIVRMPAGSVTSVVRRDDFLVLGFEFRELAFEGRGATGAFHREGTETPHLVVVAPPQSIAEEAFFEADPNYKQSDSDAPAAQNAKTGPDTPATLLPPPPVKALLAKPSRLVFGLPDPNAPLALSSAELLDWNRLTPSLVPVALPGSVMLARPDQAAVLLPPALLTAVARRVEQNLGAAPSQPVTAGAHAPLVARNRRPIDVSHVPLDVLLRPFKPSPTQTAIEAPFRLLVSPNQHGGWVHAPAPVTHGGRTELWHTRLGVRSGDTVLEEVDPFRTLRAIWSRDHDVATAFDRPFLMSLDQDDRRQLVHLSSDFTLPVLPRPIGVQRFMLSALGAWLDTEFGIEPPQGFSIEEWRHRATLARDHYVRVVYKGFLFPFGHRASLVKITERKIEHGPDGVPTAYLRQRMFIIVRERERAYPPAEDPNAYKSLGRETPLRRVRITTVVTPNLDPPAASQLGASQPIPIKAFWPRVANDDFRFHLKSWDWEGREVDFLAPLAFVRADYDGPSSDPFAQALADFNSTAASRRTYATGGQQVALAETDAGSLSRTALETESMTFKVLKPASGRKEPPCYPQLEQAAVFMPPLRQISGPSPATPVTIDTYIKEGYDPGTNRAKVFATVVGAAPSLDYAASGSADKAGGVATPSLAIRAVSRELGVVGDDTPAFAAGTFDPKQFFPSTAKLLGGISLADILATVLPGDFLGKTPALITENTPTAVRTKLDWETTDLVTHSVFVPKRGGSGARLVLHSELLAPKNGTPPVFSLSGVLTDFVIDFAEVIEVGFRQLSFTSVGGKKPDVHVVIDQSDVRFKGPLAFVQTIKDHLNLGGFTDPPFLDVSPAGIQVGYSLAIPTVAVGVFSLQNLALGSRLMLPFTGEPIRLRFNVSERQNPFLVSVAPFGGGGFFALAVGVDGVEVLEVSVEFGGAVAIDLGVASGGVYVMAGIYIKIELATPEKSLLTGYVRMGGSLQVLGIITISIEFYLGLTYAKPKAWGEVRVSVKVEILGLSKSVTITARKEFAGGEGDPPFAKLMPQPRWAEYAAAFAA